MTSANATLLQVRDFSLDLPTRAGFGRVLDHVDLDVRRSEIVGLVGESGCGKSTLARAILGILSPGAKVASGAIVFDEENLLALTESALLKRIRARRIGFVPQDPFQAFNPLFKVGGQILETMRWRGPPGVRGDRKAARQRLVGLVERVGVAQPDVALRRYPHEFSGGQLQRLTIACALACEPDLIVADEPTSALDVTTQQKILALLRDLTTATRVALLLVSHDLGLVAQMCDRVIVMYAGQCVESLQARKLVRDGRHPYTRGLVACHPERDGALQGIPGIVPALDAMPSGCRYHPRCPERFAPCALARPVDRAADESHRTHCYRYETVAPVDGAGAR